MQPANLAGLLAERRARIAADEASASRSLLRALRESLDERPAKSIAAEFPTMRVVSPAPAAPPNGANGCASCRMLQAHLTAALAEIERMRTHGRCSGPAALPWIWGGPCDEGAPQRIGLPKLRSRRWTEFCTIYRDELARAVREQPDAFTFGVDDVQRQAEMFFAEIQRGAFSMQQPALRATCARMRVRCKHYVIAELAGVETSRPKGRK